MRSADQQYHELSSRWLAVHEAIDQGHAPNLIEMRELTLELLSFHQRHHDQAQWITDQALADLVRWFDLRLQTAPPESSGLKDRREADYDLARYCLVRDLVEAGVTGRKPGNFPAIACSTAVEILRYLDHPAGRARGGSGSWVNARAIKESCRRAHDAADAWTLADDDDLTRIEVTPGLIQAATAKPSK